MLEPVVGQRVRFRGHDGAIVDVVQVGARRVGGFVVPIQPRIAFLWKDDRGFDRRERVDRELWDALEPIP